MKISFPKVAVGSCLGLVSILSGLYPVQADPVFGDLMKRQASFEVKNASVDDYILAVSRAYHVNLIFDSTRAPQDAPPISETIQNYSLWGGLQFFTSRRGINSKQSGDSNAILLWQQPDVARLARELVASGQVKTPPADVPAKSQLVFNERKIQPLLLDFFRGQKGWDKQRPFKATVDFADLPEELQARLAVQTRGEVWDMTTGLASSQWFLDSFWQQARLRFMEGRDGATGETRQEVTVFGTFARGEMGTTQQQSVFVAAPESLVNRINEKSQRPADRNTALANSSLATAYRPAEPTTLDLSAQADLTPKVTLQVKRRPLAEVVKALGEKGGIALSVSAEAGGQETLLTLGIDQMPLHETMSALTRLLGLEWSRSARGGYIAAGQRGTVLETRLLQASRLTPAVLQSESAALKAQKAQKSGQLTAKIKLALGEEALTRAEGAAFSDLPADLQNELRLQVQEGLAPSFVEAQSVLRERLEALNGAWHLELDVPAEKSRPVTVNGRQIDIASPIRVRVKAQNGQTLASIPIREAPRETRLQTRI